MTDDAMQLLADFRREIPFPADEHVDAAHARVAQTSRRRRPIGRSRLGLALAAAALVFAAAAVAAVKEGPWWQSGQPPVDPQEVVSVARDNLPAHVDVDRARTVATSGRAALVAVPLDATGYCLIPAVGDSREGLGAQCEYQVTNPERGDDDRTVSVTRAAHDGEPAVWIVYGRITDPRAARIDLGAFTLDLAPGGFFLDEVPQTQWSRLSGSATHGAILDGAGAVLRRGCVDWALAPGAAAADGEYPVPLWSDSSGGTCTPRTPAAPPTVELDKARKAFDVTLTQDYSLWKSGETLTFEVAPRSDGSMCLVASGPQRSLGFTNGCSASSGGASKERPIDAALGAQLTHAGGEAVYAWDLSGSVAPGAGIARLELRSDTTTTPVTFGDGFFFAQLPATSPGPQQGTVSLPSGQWLLVGLDAAGNEVARVDLAAQQREESPH